MNPVETNGVAVIDGSKQSPGADASTAHPRLDLKTPYVPEKKNLGSRLGENRRILFLGGGIVLVLILVAFSGISRQPFAAQKSPLKNSSLQMVSHSETSTVTSSITPILEVGQSPQQEIQSGRVQPEQLERMAPKHTPRTPASSLAEIPPFENGGLWHPAPYREGAEANGSADIGTSSGKGTDRKDGEAMDKPSLVFASNAPAAALRPQSIAPDTSVGIGLSPGTRLRARLESAVSTAVHAPVIAIIEYSYERNGEIVVPAGSKMFGRIESADRTGYVELRFDSLLMPDGSSVAVTATATDLRLQPLRGKVEGRHTGKNILVRSVAGVGEIA
ncbi:MAG TPA: TrbI/VirB10 family protein, partial [Terriglobales bacterium]|nr:TrbI/VirB10 family protein [Terriglobales bacterium]